MDYFGEGQSRGAPPIYANVHRLSDELQYVSGGFRGVLVGFTGFQRRFKTLRGVSKRFEVFQDNSAASMSFREVSGSLKGVLRNFDALQGSFIGFPQVPREF